MAVLFNFPASSKVSSGGGSSKLTSADFTYTGTSQLIDDGELGWRLKLLTSGTLTFNKEIGNIDVFLVGGGASGMNGTSGGYDGTVYGPGGGGGYTKTAKAITPLLTPYSIVIGAGGNADGNGTAGGASSAFGYSSEGGKKGQINGIYNSGGTYSLAHFCYGGNGGSAGGSTYSVSSSYSEDYSSYIDGLTTAGGSNGSNTANYGTNAKGQGTTTREFEESNGDLYAGGGGAKGATGGEGGGGKGGSGSNIAGAAGTANTGGGGGGGTYSGQTSGNGGSGIVIIRNAR